MVLPSPCGPARGPAGAGAERAGAPLHLPQVFSYTVSGQSRSIYYCGSSAAATTSTQVSSFPLCTVS
jgi:hypothetical protein